MIRASFYLSGYLLEIQTESGDLLDYLQKILKLADLKF
jgi:hypothetical protein